MDAFTFFDFILYIMCYGLVQNLNLDKNIQINRLFKIYSFEVY